MARRPHPVARLVLATTVLGAALAALPLAAGAQEAPGSAPTLAQVLRGEVDGVTAEATTSDSPAGAMGVTVEVTNEGDEPLAVAIPFGTLLVTEDEGDQTLTVTPPPTDDVIEVAAAGGVPTVEFAPGTSSEELPAYCTEMEDGYPFEPVPVSPIDDAHPVLAETLRTTVAQEADEATTQDAVWWLTDQPSLPVSDHLTGLLAVDTAAFAAAPHRVTPDTGYVPLWMRGEVPPGAEPAPLDEQEAAGILDESFEGPGAPASDGGTGGAGIGVALWAILVGVVVITAVVVASRAGRGGAPAAVPVRARTTPGWYPDPWGGGGHRYWDGQRWTTSVSRRP